MSSSPHSYFLAVTFSSRDTVVTDIKWGNHKTLSETAQDEKEQKGKNFADYQSYQQTTGLDPCCQLSSWIRFHWTKSMVIPVSQLSVATFKIYESVLRSSKGNTEALRAMELT